MRCPRCGGQVSHEWFRSEDGDMMPWSYDGWRCIYCGEIFDPLILLNRMKAKALEKQGTAVGAMQARLNIRRFYPSRPDLL